MRNDSAIRWMDWKEDGNLLALVGSLPHVYFCDKRGGKIIQEFRDIHKSKY